VIISFAGTDGSGKSTVSRLAGSRLAERGVPVEHVDRWDIVADPGYPAVRFMRPDVPDARQCVAEMPGTPRFLFLMWSISMALLGREPAPDPRRPVLLDGYWMKHAASEIVYGLDQDWVESVVAGLPPADLVLYLRAEPEVAWSRKEGRDVMAYECGGDESCSRDAFLNHQHRIREILDGWAGRFGWVRVDAGQSVDEVADQCAGLVLGRLDAPVGAGSGAAP
jgi:dTMP kinase